VVIVNLVVVVVIVVVVEVIIVLLVLFCSILLLHKLSVGAYHHAKPGDSLQRSECRGRVINTYIASCKEL
jgi:hypothetical protein